MSEWISVKDELPVHNGKYIVACTDYVISATYLKASGWWLCGNTIDNITHWQPLPAPPNKEDS